MHTTQTAWERPRDNIRKPGVRDQKIEKDNKYFFNQYRRHLDGVDCMVNPP